MLTVDEQFIKRVLCEHTALLRNIHTRIMCVHTELMDTDGFIKSVSMKKIEWDKQGSGQGGIKRDLSDVMLLHQRLTREREIELRTEMCRLTEEEESINRIWVCFQTLRGREFSYLQDLYVQGKPYKAVEAESGRSHRIFENARKKGIANILKLYDSPNSNLQIIGNKRKPAEIRHKENKEKSEEFEQLTLEI